MSLQILTLNCLACHILAEHPQFNKVRDFTVAKHERTKVTPPAMPVKDKSKSNIKNQLRA